MVCAKLIVTNYAPNGINKRKRNLQKMVTGKFPSSTFTHSLTLICTPAKTAKA